jgi:hypothetical protein
MIPPIMGTASKAKCAIFLTPYSTNWSLLSLSNVLLVSKISKSADLYARK